MLLLPERVREYRHALGIKDLLLEEEERIRLCSIMEVVLSRCMADEKERNNIDMIDGVLAAKLDVESGLYIEGLVVWMGRNGWFLDPIKARIDFDQDVTAVVSYYLCFGDAKTGLRKFPYKPHSKHLFDSVPSNWCYEFHGVSSYDHNSFADNGLGQNHQEENTLYLSYTLDKGMLPCIISTQHQT